MKPPSLLHNARITTLDAMRPDVEALVVSDGRIALAGTRGDAEQFAASMSNMRAGVQRIDLGGRRVIPGLFDLHAHLDREGLKLSHPPMAGLKSRRDVLERISMLAAAAEAGDWIVTMPIGDPPFYFFEDSANELALYPTRDELDEAAPRNPVYVRPILGFWRWAPRRETLVSAANSAALHAAGLDEGVAPASASVVIERDRNGRMTGRFLETTTASILELLYFSRAVAFGRGDRIDGLARSQAIANRYGITSTLEGHGVETAVIDAYKSLHADGRLTVRAELCFSPSWSALGQFDLPGFLDRWAGWLSGPGLGDDRLRLRGMFVNPLYAGDDRIRAGRGGYTGFAGYNFDSALPEERVPELLVELARLGVRAVGLSPRLFPLYRETHSRSSISGQGWMIQHCGPLSALDIDTARSIGIGLSMLPVEFIYKEASAARGDPALRRDWVPLRRLIDRGVRFSLASDNIPPSLFFAIWACIAREDYRGEILEDPDGPISRLEALKAATLWSAEILGCADRRGTLAPGKDADLAVLDTDFFTCPVESIKHIGAYATMLAGEWVHATPEAAPRDPAAHLTEGELRVTILIHGGLVVTGDGDNHLREGCDVLVENDRIAAIGQGIAPPASASVQVVDARGCIVMPGFINAHLHSNESFEQGATDNLPLELWRLRTYPPFDAPVLSEMDHYLRAMLCAVVSIKSGVTTVQDDVITPGYAAPDAVAGACRAYRDIGLRAWVTTSLGDVGLMQSHPFLEDLLPDEVKRALAATPAPGAAEQLDLFRHNFAAWHGCEGRIRILLGPRAPQRCSVELLQGATELSERCGVPVHTHVLETRTQAVSAQLQYGRTLISFMRDIGMLTPRLTINHGIWLTADDVALLARHGCSVTHNPLSNLKLGSGMCPLRELLDAGVNVALGTDGMTTSDTADLLSAMRAAALLHKIATPDYARWVSAAEVFRLATRGGAASGLMQNELGVLAPGKLADVILVDRNAWPFVPLHDPINQLILSATPEVVLTSIIGGRMVMRDRKLLFVDEGALREEIAEAAERFRRELHPRMLGAAQRVNAVFAEMYRKAVAEPVADTINPKFLM